MAKCKMSENTREVIKEGVKLSSTIERIEQYFILCVKVNIGTYHNHSPMEDGNIIRSIKCNKKMLTSK